MAKPHCHRCQLFRVTWDERFRYECKGFGFRSVRIPSVVVRETSGEDCRLFQPKTDEEDAD